MCLKVQDESYKTKKSELILKSERSLPKNQQWQLSKVEAQNFKFVSEAVNLSQ